MKKTKKKQLKQNIFILLVLSALLGLGGYYYLNSRTEQQASIMQRYVFDHEIITLPVANHKLKVEVVFKSDSMMQGLSGREAIGADGMLFLLQEKRFANFWMKEMKFDLDLIFIADNQIVQIITNVPKPQPGEQLSDLESYRSDQRIHAVLELPAGQAVKLGLKVGDQVVLPIAEP